MNIVEVVRTLRGQRHPFRLVAGIALVRLGVSSRIRIAQQGYSLRFFAGSTVSLRLWVNQEDPIEEERDFFRAYLKPGDSVIDAGANVGHLTLEGSVLVGDSGHVMSIEAHPVIFKFLSQNVEENRCRNISLHNVALGNQTGSVRFSSVADDSANRVELQGGALEVRACRLDDLPTPGGRIALLKIDVEGYEELALAGAPETLDRTECVYFEFGKALSDRYGYGLSDLTARFAKHGFQVFRLRDKTLERLPAAWGSHPGEYDNLVAVRDAHAFAERMGRRQV